MTEDKDSKDLENLIKQAKNGDTEAFSGLYNELYSPLYRFVLSRTKDRDRTLDICQEVFLKWYKSLSTYEIKMRPLSYLMMIAIRLIINDSKKVTALMLSEDSEEYIRDEDAVGQDIEFDFNLDIENIKSLFEELSERQKDVLTMRYIADADTETIAEALDITHANVRKIESRAIIKLKEFYKAKYKN